MAEASKYLLVVDKLRDLLENAHPGLISWRQFLDERMEELIALWEGKKGQIMDMHEYQKAAIATAIYPDVGCNWQYVLLGLCGEVGETANSLKKAIRDDGGEITPERQVKVAEEIGDCLWYCAMLCNELELDMSEVALRNLQKLTARKLGGTLHGSGDSR